jgi:hypothetical protein
MAILSRGEAGCESVGDNECQDWTVWKESTLDEKPSSSDSSERTSEVSFSFNEVSVMIERTGGSGVVFFGRC